MNKKTVGRPKGTPKTGGRKKGTPNKITQSVREWINFLLDKNRIQFEKDLLAVEPKDRLNILIKLLEYTTPKMQSVQTDIEFIQEVELSKEEAKELLKELETEY
ncbi:MAG: hypothetical protein GX361_03815 [Bacteroidales bacterium]|nr:hypothetical protein [Bacteroidales bacterium]